MCVFTEPLSGKQDARLLRFGTRYDVCNAALLTRHHVKSWHTLRCFLIRKFIAASTFYSCREERQTLTRGRRDDEPQTLLSFSQPNLTPTG